MKELKTLTFAAMTGDIHGVKRLLSEGHDAKADDSKPLRLAVKHGHLEVVKLLIPFSNPKAKESDALIKAIMCERLDLVKILIPVSDPIANDAYPLRLAIEQGLSDIVQALIPASITPGKESEALQIAVENNNLEMVDILLPLSDPKANKSIALQKAVWFASLEIIHKLCGVCDVDTAFNELCAQHFSKASLPPYKKIDILSSYVSTETLLNTDRIHLTHLPKAQAKVMATRLEKELPNVALSVTRHRM